MLIVRASMNSPQEPRKARDAEPVAAGRRLDLDDYRLGLVELPEGEVERPLLVRNDEVLLNRRHPTIQRLISWAAREPIPARMLLETLIAADPEFARGADPRRLEWDLLVRHQTWLRRLAQPLSDGDGVAAKEAE